MKNTIRVSANQMLLLQSVLSSYAPLFGSYILLLGLIPWTQLDSICKVKLYSVYNYGYSWTCGTGIISNYPFQILERDFRVGNSKVNVDLCLLFVSHYIFDCSRALLYAFGVFSNDLLYYTLDTSFLQCVLKWFSKRECEFV